MNSARLASCIVATLAVLGCAGESPTAPSAVAGQLAGAWTLISMRPIGQAEQATPSGATYTLTFADGRLSTRADCNTCSGSYALSGLTLTAGPAMACTRAACPTMAFENVYTDLLGGDSTVTLSGSTLSLSSTRGMLRFSR